MKMDTKLLNRRRVLAKVAGLGAVTLAGCSNPGDEADGETDDDPNENEGDDAEGEADDDGDNDAIEPPAR